jgi:hypothetical protein
MFAWDIAKYVGNSKQGEAEGSKAEADAKQKAS